MAISPCSRAGIKVTPHHLSHTFATQLLNAGRHITTIQALMGHSHLNTPMTYARVHDRTVAEGYFAAMTVLEKRLKSHVPWLSGLETEESSPAPCENGNDQRHLLRLVVALQAGPLNETQQAVVTELRYRLETMVMLPTAMSAQLERVVNEQTTRLPERIPLP